MSRRPMRASQRVLVDFARALANCPVGHEFGVSTVFRLDRSLRSARAGSCWDWGKDVGVEERRERLSKNSDHSRQAGRKKRKTVQCLSGGLLSS